MDLLLIKILIYKFYAIFFLISVCVGIFYSIKKRDIELFYGCCAVGIVFPVFLITIFFLTHFIVFG